MKKIIVLCFALITVILATGCTAKESKLVCTQTQSGVLVTFNVDFAGNTIKAMDFSYDMDLSSYSDAQVNLVSKQDFCTRVQSSMSGFKDAFKNCSQNIEDKHLNVKADLDVDKVATSFFSKKATPTYAKSELEKVGYSCTIQK